MLSTGRLACVEWAVAASTRNGESQSGDLHVVQSAPQGALLAVIDGLGHGTEAARAARLASETLASASGRSVISLVRRCHEALTGTRGAVMCLAQLDAVDETISWLAVGNVEGLLLRAAGPAMPAREGVVMRAGVVGHQLPPLRAAITPVGRGDLLAFATDGIRPEFTRLLDSTRSPRELAQQVLSVCARDTDDALVLVARYLGAESCEASESMSR